MHKGQPNKIDRKQAQECAFADMQERLIKKPVLKLPDYDKPFVLRTDASDSGLGAALMQQHGEMLYSVA